jgi:hypothetical protein
LFRCSGTKYSDWVSCVVGFLRCAFSLLSSIGGLGSITNSLTLINSWYFGLIGFVVATVPRSYPRVVLQRVLGWVRDVVAMLKLNEKLSLFENIFWVQIG